MRSFDRLLQRGELAVVQGVGYPNPERSHFESMDVWQSADPTRKTTTGWIGRSVNELHNATGGIPVMHIGPNRLPLALQGATGGAISINNQMPYRLELGGGEPAQAEGAAQAARRPRPAGQGRRDGLAQFRLSPRGANADHTGPAARSSQGHEHRPVQQLRPRRPAARPQRPAAKLAAHRAAHPEGFRHARLLRHARRLRHALRPGAAAPQPARPKWPTASRPSSRRCEQTGHDKRVRLMTFSEFGRRVQENASKGTDHGAGSCLFVAGPGLKGGAVGEHPSLSDLDARRPEISHRLPPGVRHAARRAGSAATARPSSAASSSISTRSRARDGGVSWTERRARDRAGCARSPRSRSRLVRSPTLRDKEASHVRTSPTGVHPVSAARACWRSSPFGFALLLPALCRRSGRRRRGSQSAEQPQADRPRLPWLSRRQQRVSARLRRPELLRRRPPAALHRTGQRLQDDRLQEVGGRQGQRQRPQDRHQDVPQPARTR